MKKTYVKPEAEKIEFCYRDQVVAASGSGSCTIQYVGTEDNSCTEVGWDNPNGPK